MKAVGAYVYAGGFSVGVRRAGFDVVAHLEGDNGYGVADAKLNWPDLQIYHGPPRWPMTELRDREIDLLYCNPPCFTGDTKVITAHGPKSIQKLVRERAVIDVLSIDSSGKRVFRPIVGWHENAYEGDLYDISLPNRKLRARATADHRFLTRRGWVSASKLKSDDEVCVGSDCPNARQKELINGLMLGDSQIKKYQAQLHVFQSTPEYVELKRRALEPFICQEVHEAKGTTCGEFTRKPRHGFYLKTQRWVAIERDRWYAPDRSRRVPRDLELTPLTLAVWYLDDGTLRALSTATVITPKRPNGSFGGSVQLCTDRLPREEIDFLLNRLCSMGIEARIAGKNTERAIRYPRILITTSGFKKFINLIGSYVPPEMRHKLPSWAPKFDPSLWDLGEPDVFWSRVNVRRVPRTYKNFTKVFCLDIEETQNFVTHGGVVHNCAIFSPLGIVTTRGADSWRDDERLQHWWDCVRALEEVAPRAWALESVTQAYSRGRPVIDEITKRALVHGYSVTHLFVDAKWHGIPQSRKRMFVVAHRPAKLVGYAPSHNWAPPPTVGEVLETVVAPGEGIEVNPRYVEALRNTRPGRGLSDAWMTLNPGYEDNRNAQGKVKGRPSFQDQRLDPTTQMGAFVGHKFYHPSEDRAIGLNEARALCGYPPDFKLAGPSTGKQSMLARAVMPPVAEWLARSIAASLSQRDASWEERRVTMIDVREPDRPVLDLTDQYLDRSGRVHLRVHANGTIVWSPNTRSGAPKTVSERVNVPRRIETPAPVVTVISGVEPTAGEGSGKFIQRLWRDTDLSVEAILVAVHASYAGRTTGPSDVYYNYRILLDAGVPVRPWPGRTKRRSSADEKPVLTQKPQAANGIAARSSIVPERSGVVDRAMLYFANLSAPGTPAPLSSARIAWFLQEELRFDRVYHAKDHPRDVIPVKIGELWVPNSSWMWMRDEWRRIAMRLIRVADRVIFCQNDYAMILGGYYQGAMRDETRYVVMTTAPELSIHRKHEVNPVHVDWNVLTYQPRSKTDTDRRNGIYYYGSFRQGRRKVFDRYFIEPSRGLVVSASNAEDVNQFARAYPSLAVVPRAEDVYAELESWASTLLLEDDRSTREFVSPPNRFYEALSSRTPMIFDRASEAMFTRYGYDLARARCIVSGPRGVEDALDRVEAIGELQGEWHRDFVGDLRARFHEVYARIETLGRSGQPASLKRYQLTEEGGTY